MRFAKILLLATLLLTPATKAFAEPIEGLFNFTLGNVDVFVLGGFGYVDWNPPLNPPPNAVRTYGLFDIDPNAARTLAFASPDFSTLNGPDGTEKIQDLTQNPADANYVPIGLSGGIVNFLQISERPNWTFTELFLAPGDGGTPFSFSQQCNPITNTCNTGASLFFAGTGFDSITGITSLWTATISAQYTNFSIAQLLAAAVAGTLPNNSWSGTFEAIQVSNIPEPATMLTFGAGAALLAARRRRQIKK